MAISDSGTITVFRKIPASGVIGNKNLIIPYPPTFKSTAAKITDPDEGACT